MIGWFIRLYPDIDLENIVKFMKKKVKMIVKYNPDFSLVDKFIFSSEKASQQSRSFVRRSDSRPKAIYVKVRGLQALEVTLAVKKVIKSPEFSKIYSIKVYFSP